MVTAIPPSLPPLVLGSAEEEGERATGSGKGWGRMVGASVKEELQPLSGQFICIDHFLCCSFACWFAVLFVCKQ